MPLPLIPFGRRSGLSVPRVNIGGMRLPNDLDEAVSVLRHAIDRGLRYIDTCRLYGDSELKVGRALKDGYRDKVILSTKWSIWINRVEERDDDSADTIRRRIEESLRRLEVDRLDFYQVWAVLEPEHWRIANRKGGPLEGILKAKAEGLIGHVGLTTHETPDRVLAQLDTADWCESLLVTYNLLERTYAPVITKARRLGIATIAMNPLGGGKLVESSPILSDLARELGAPSMADLAIRFVLSHPDLDCLISGIGRIADVDDTLASAARPPLSADEVCRIDAFLAQHSGQAVGFCTGCGYCRPCPQAIDIPAVMDAIHQHRFLGLPKGARDRFGWATRSAKVDTCTRCRACETRCPQHLKIVDELAWAGRTFAAPSANG